MKILYAIQGTGNGHVSRAIEIIPWLKQKGKVDVLISGYQSELKLPFEVTYKYNGLSFIFGKRGGIDLWNTYLRMNSIQLLREIKTLPIEKYDLIISDFEPVSSWAAWLAKIPSVGLSNQVATIHPHAPKPKMKNMMGKMILEHYAPNSFSYGLHYEKIDNNIFTPVIRKKIREIQPTDGEHYTVYLPSYEDERIINFLKNHREIEWQVFSKSSKKKYRKKNVLINPIREDLFIKSMASSKGVLCNAGFGTTTEALFLKKKLMVIPMKGQYEQHCNAAALKKIGVPTIKKLKKKYVSEFAGWISENNRVEVNYPDITGEIVEMIIDHHAGKKVEATHPEFLFQ